MFTKAKNIDTAFKNLRMFCLVVLASVTLLAALISWKSFEIASSAQSRLYVLVNGKALEAYAEGRNENIPVEARDHIKTFHQYFFNLDPDEKVIQASITKALYLSDGSAKREYDNLKESGYYRNIISGNVSQRYTIDSVAVNIDHYPYAFRCFGKLDITRATSIVQRSLVTEGQIRSVLRSDNNSHGMLIEKWKTIENKDISIKQR